jgi:hypothetical protein
MIRFVNLTKFPEARVQAALGLLPQFFSEIDMRPAREQINTAYAHGGGWHPFNSCIGGQVKGNFTFNKKTLTLTYPGDPPMRAIAQAQIRDDIILVFEHAWVMIWNANGDWELARID